MNHTKKRLYDKWKATQEGRRWAAFYASVRDARAGQHTNPYPPDSIDAIYWQAGREYAAEEVGEAET